MDEMVECPLCAGEGEVYPTTPIGMGIIPEPGTCPLCKGYSKVEPWLDRWYRKNSHG